MGMALGGGGSKERPKPSVNVTPLVDVALVILIIFMVVTPMMTKTFWLNLPKKPDDKQATEQPPPDTKNKPLVMTVDKGGVVRVNRTKLARNEIAQRLPRMLAAQRQKVLYFDAHDEVDYGIAVEVMDLARSAGARSIAIVTKPVLR